MQHIKSRAPLGASTALIELRSHARITKSVLLTMDASPPPIGRTAKPEPSPPNRAGIRRAAARAAQNKAASNLAQALRDLAKEKIARQVLEEHSLHLEQRLDASVRENLELRQDISNLHYELASARAADVPSLLESIGLVLRLHQLVVSNCDSADRQACACPTTPPPLASPRQLDADLPSPAPGLASPTAPTPPVRHRRLPRDSGSMEPLDLSLSGQRPYVWTRSVAFPYASSRRLPPLMLRRARRRRLSRSARATITDHNPTINDHNIGLAEDRS